jgi:hypothetical protein
MGSQAPGVVKGVEWKPGTLEFVTRRGEGSVRVWWIMNAIGAKDLKDIAADDGADDVVVEHEGKGVFLAQLVWGLRLSGSYGRRGAVAGCGGSRRRRSIPVEAARCFG